MKPKIENFSAKERIKRVNMAKELQKKGHTLEEISKFFGVSIETVNSYLADELNYKIKETKLNEPKLNTLSGYSDKEIDLKEFFKNSNKDSQGFVCPLCKQYNKYISGIVFKKDIFICRGCYERMDAKDLDKLQNNV